MAPYWVTPSTACWWGEISSRTGERTKIMSLIEALLPRSRSMPAKARSKVRLPYPTATPITIVSHVRLCACIAVKLSRCIDDACASNTRTSMLQIINIVVPIFQSELGCLWPYSTAKLESRGGKVKPIVRR